MIIKKFNESVDYINEIKVRVKFSGEIVVPLSSIKKTEYFQEYSDDDDSDYEYFSNIYYGVENYIHNEGLTPYNIDFQTSDGKIINDTEIREYERFLKDKNKYNI